MKHLILTIQLLFVFIIASAQLSIKGVVQDDQGEVIRGATVKLSSASVSRITLTDENGHFAFLELQQGDYSLTITNIGFEDHSQNVSPGNHSPENLQIRLSILSKQLQSVEIVGRSARKYNSDYSFSATKIAALNKDIPQSITAITKELIADRQAFQLADAVKVASGVIPSSYYNQYAIRGISQNEEGQIINGMRTRQYYFLQPLTSNIERVEVIKGPASAGFASVDPGGSINLVTKKPLAVSRREIMLSAGSFSTIRGALDFTGPLNESKTLLYRVNAAYQDARSFRDYVGNRSLLISPSFSYIPNNKTAVNIEMIYSNMNGNLDRGQPIFGAVAGQTNLKSTPISLNLSASNDFFKSKEMIVTVNVLHRFSSWLTFNTSYMKQTWTEDLQEHRTTNAFAVDLNNVPVTSLTGMQFVQRKQFWSVDNVSSYFNASFSTGKIRHQLVAGYDLNSWEKTKGGGQNAARGFLLKDGTVASTYVPANQGNYQTVTIGGVVLPKPNVSYFDLNNPGYTIRSADDYSFNVRTILPAALTTNNAVYIQEQLQWSRFILLLGMRQEWFKDITNYTSSNESSFTNDALLPRIGLTYALTKNINLYGTYLEGFQPQSNTVTLMPNTGNFYNTPKSAAIFAPLTSDLKEVGVKALLLKNRIQVNAAYYIINQKNILMNANVPAFPDSLVTRGADQSKGFELEVAGFILPNWQVNISYSYIDARIKRDAKPELVGLRKENTPFNTGNFWTRYNFKQNTRFKGLGAGLGFQYSGDKVPWFTRAFKVPSYTLLDLALYYTPGKGDMQLALNVNNVLDKTYWIGAQNYLRLFPGAPRNILLTATYKF